MANGYCVKCKAQREIQDPQQIIMKNGRPATQGRCPVCGTKITTISKVAAPDPAASPERAEGPLEPGEAATRPGSQPPRSA